MGIVRFYTPDGNAASLSALLSEFIAFRQGQVTAQELCAELERREAGAELTITPSPADLRRTVIEHEVTRWMEAATAPQGGPRFVADRRRKRFDRSTGLIAAIDEVDRRRYIASIRQCLFVEGPGMYRDQARALMDFEPGLDRVTLANECAEKVRDAVLEGTAGQISESDEAA